LQILTIDNKTLMLNDLPEELTEDIRFAVLDNNDTANPDYYYLPLIFLESFTGPAAVLEIGPYEIMMPLDWSTIVGDPECAELEVIPLTNLNDRGFRTYCFNPLSSFRPEFHEINMVNVYTEVKWYFPKIKQNQLLATPLTQGSKPVCAYFVKEMNRQNEVIDYTKAW
jgi:hypothetical protein